MADIEVRDLSEAVRLADEWKARDDTHGFRGQNKPWRLPRVSG
jgi:hypothetical protein